MVFTASLGSKQCNTNKKEPRATSDDNRLAVGVLIDVDAVVIPHHPCVAQCR